MPPAAPPATTSRVSCFALTMADQPSTNMELLSTTMTGDNPPEILTSQAKITYKLRLKTIEFVPSCLSWQEEISSLYSPELSISHKDAGSLWLFLLIVSHGFGVCKSGAGLLGCHAMITVQISRFSDHQRIWLVKTGPWRAGGEQIDPRGIESGSVGFQKKTLKTNPRE